MIRSNIVPLFCCVYCGAPTLRYTCRAHRDLRRRDRPYQPRGILYQPSQERPRSLR